MLQGPGGAAARSGLLCLLFAPAVWPATLDYQKIFAGNAGVRIAAVSTDGAGNVYLAGSTTASDFLVKDAPQPRNSGTAATVSRDGGVTWSPLGYLPEVEAVVANPRNARLLLAEGVYGVYRSTDGGETWTTVVDLKVERQRIGYTDAPQWDLRDASVAYVPSTAGVLKSVDGGVTWRLMDNGIEPGNCCTGAGLAIDPFVAGRLAFTINERAYVSRDAGASWTRLALPSAIRTPFIVIDPAAAGTWYAYDYQGAYRSEDAGATWTGIPLGSQLGWLLADPNVPGRLYARAAEGVRRSDDRGRTWSAIVFPETSPKMGGVAAFSIRPGDPNWLLAAGSDERGNAVCLLSRDGGKAWGPIGVVRTFYSFRVDASQPNVVYGAGPPTQDAFVLKLNAAGEVVYSTYLGGQGSDTALAMSVDPSGNVYVAGTSESIDFPGNPARLYAGISPGLFAARLDGAGKPVWTTLFGGGGYDTITAIGQGQGGTLAIGGYSQNQTYVAKLAGDGRSFLFTAKVVGQLNSIAADGSGNVLAVGIFGESNFTNLMKFGAAGEVVSQRALPVVPERVAVDASGGVYVAGNAMATGAFAGRIDTRCPLPNGLPERERPRYMTDIYVSKLDVFETLLGGACRDVVTDLAVSGNEVVVTGDTWSDSFPVTEPLFNPPPAGYSRPFVARWNTAGALAFSTYLPLGAITRASGYGAAVYVAENTPEGAYLDPVIGRLLKVGTAAGTAAPRRVVDAFSRANMPLTAQEFVVVEMPGFRPDELGGVSVEFNGLRAGILALRNGEIECVTPAALEGQTLAWVQVVNGSARSGRFYVELAPVSPAIYAARNANGTLNSKWAPAAPGSEVTVLFTGAGARGPGSFTMPLLFWPEGGPQQQVDQVEPAAGYPPGMFVARVRMPSTKGEVRVFMAPMYPTQFAYPNAVLGVTVIVGDPPPKPPTHRFPHNAERPQGR